MYCGTGARHSHGGEAGAAADYAAAFTGWLQGPSRDDKRGWLRSLGKHYGSVRLTVCCCVV